MEKASTADMVKDAIKTLGERTGSSLHNIKKYIEAVYKVDMRYRAPRIRKFLRSAVGDGVVVQTRGRGASGSFKLPPRQQSGASRGVPAVPARKAASASASSSTPLARAMAKARAAGAAGAKKATSRTTATARKASGTTVSTSASRVSARTMFEGKKLNKMEYTFEQSIYLSPVKESKQSATASATLQIY
ncbi:histone H1.3-like [Thrips palmi]|uniref:Histone H1.3-like n=1 Tax=Thrips palmi TaxID=161013 RepID=A0A6P8ZBD9_THRPL|nr:histone H1.3-like [Thrips palmi]